MLTNFYLTKSSVGRMTRLKGTVGSLRQLNLFCSIEEVDHRNLEDLKVLEEFIIEKKISVLVLNEIKYLVKNSIYSINSLCFKNNIGFVFAANYGIAGSVYTDYGNHFEISDKTGEDIKNGIISRVVFYGKMMEITIKNMNVFTFQPSYFKVDFENISELKEVKIIKIYFQEQHPKNVEYNDEKM